jgi:beta-glucosidase
MTQSMQFPADFTWGVATSAFQIEGASRADGKGVSIWDSFCRTPGTIDDHSNGDVACDHYHTYKEDVALMAALGVDAYRFSMAWTRVQPEGKGAWNEAGFDFYKRLMDALQDKGIAPHLTLYHWDLPQGLQDGGGWYWASQIACGPGLKALVLIFSSLTLRTNRSSHHLSRV